MALSGTSIQFCLFQCPISLRNKKIEFGSDGEYYIQCPICKGKWGMKETPANCERRFVVCAVCYPESCNVLLHKSKPEVIGAKKGVIVWL